MLSDENNRPLRGSKIVMDSMRGYLDNISNVLVKTVDSYPYQNMSKLDSASSEPEDETSIQETITIKDRIDGKLFSTFISNH